MSAPAANANDVALNALSVDVEEWFHILNLPSTPPPSRWSELDPTVDANTQRLLEILETSGTRATFFVLGWVAKQHPELVSRIHAAGHEIACHGDMHELCFEQGETRFEEDLRRAKRTLEEIVEEPVLGYRAPGFSIVESTPWAFDVIERLGFRYDSSIFPARRIHGGAPGAAREPHRIELGDGRKLAEFPMTVAEFGGLRVAFAGGGYLRLFPYRLVRRGIRRFNAAGRPACVYVHPREIDPDHPRIDMPLGRRFRSYVNLRSTEPKLRRLCNDFSFAPLRDVLAARGLL